MKTLFIASIFSLALVLASCSRSSNSMSSNLGQVASQSATTGNWRVSAFTDNGTNQTANFTGYSFTYSTGTIVATKNGINTNGTWSVNTSSNKFNIDLGPKGSSNQPLGDLTDDWRIVSASDTQIQLTDDNNIEFLTFSKN